MLLTAGQLRNAQRSGHLVPATVASASVFLPPGTALTGLMRWVVFPVLVAAGPLMWQAARVRQVLRRIGPLPSARSGAP